MFSQLFAYGDYDCNDDKNDDGDVDDDDNGNTKPNMIILGDEARTCEDSGMQVERWTEVQTSKKRG